MKSRKQTKPAWSPRSQKSLVRELELQTALDRCRVQIAFSEKRIAEQTQTADTQAAQVAAGASHSIRQGLNRTLADVEGRERELAIFRKREDKLVAEIAALAPSDSEAAHRKKLQTVMLATSLERFKIDGVIDSLLADLRTALDGREKTSDKMLELARELEFAENVDLDTARFAALANSLPSDVADRSREWLSEFLGSSEVREPYTVGSKPLVLPETLACANVFRAGEQVFLSKAQIASVPPDDANHVPTPVEMEQAENKNFGVQPAIAQGDDALAVSGFPVR